MAVSLNISLITVVKNKISFKLWTYYYKYKQMFSPFKFSKTIWELHLATYMYIYTIVEPAESIRFGSFTITEFNLAIHLQVIDFHLKRKKEKKNP